MLLAPAECDWPASPALHKRRPKLAEAWRASALSPTRFDIHLSHSLTYSFSTHRSLSPYWDACVSAPLHLRRPFLRRICIVVALRAIHTRYALARLHCILGVLAHPSLVCWMFPARWKAITSYINQLLTSLESICTPVACR
jgi:hypothetical protein